MDDFSSLDTRALRSGLLNHPLQSDQENFDDEPQSWRLTHASLDEFVSSGHTYGTTDVARILGVPRRWVIEFLLLRGWLFRRKPWSSLTGDRAAITAGLVTRNARITSSCLLILAAGFNIAPETFIEFEPLSTARANFIRAAAMIDEMEVN